MASPVDRPATPIGSAAASQLGTPPDSRRKAIKIPEGNLGLKPQPRTPSSNWVIFAKDNPVPLQQRRRQKAMVDQGLAPEPSPFYSKTGVASPESESDRLRDLDSAKRYDEWIRYDQQQVSPWCRLMPADEVLHVALNPFWRGEERDGPYYTWLNDIYYEHNMPVVIRMVNKFRGFPQTDESEAFEKTEEGQELMRQHAPYIYEQQLRDYQSINEQENHREKSPSPDYAPSPGTLRNDNFGVADTTPYLMSHFLTSPEDPLPGFVPENVANISNWPSSPLASNLLRSRGYMDGLSAISVVANPIQQEVPSVQGGHDSVQPMVNYSQDVDMDVDTDVDMDAPMTDGGQTPYDVMTPKSGGATEHLPDEAFAKPSTASQSHSSVAPFSPLDRASVQGRPGTPYPSLGGTERGAKKRGRPRGSSSTSRASSTRRRTTKHQSNPDGLYKPDGVESSEDEMERARPKKRARKNKKTRGRGRGKRGSVAGPQD